MNKLFLYSPEWQGYAVDKRVTEGAAAIKNQLLSYAFESIEIGTTEDLITKHDIEGFDTISDHFRQAKEIISQVKPDYIFTLGGTCGSEPMPISWLNKQYGGDLCVVWYDAHGDLNTPESSQSKHFHGMPLRTLQGDGNEALIETLFSTIEAKQIILVGGRDLDEEEIRFIDEEQIINIKAEKFNEEPGLLNDIITSKGYSNVYLHTDLDVLEPNDFSNMLLPVKSGVKLDILKTSIQRIHEQFNVTGSSILEYVETDGSEMDKVIELVSLLNQS